MKLNQNAKKWIRALRSGVFKQTDGQLRRDDSFCCLGVACELYAIEHPDEKLEWDTVYSSTPRFMDNDVELPYEVKDWLGLSTVNGNFRPEDTSVSSNEKSLAGLNDLGKSFEEIADLIESQPEGLFKERV